MIHNDDIDTKNKYELFHVIYRIVFVYSEKGVLTSFLYFGKIKKKLKNEAKLISNNIKMRFT